MLTMKSLTPNKSHIVTKINGNSISQGIKFTNKKGTFKSRQQCKDCKFQGKAQVGLGYAFDITCDREEPFWRMRKGWTDRRCIHYLPKEMKPCEA